MIDDYYDMTVHTMILLPLNHSHKLIISIFHLEIILAQNVNWLHYTGNYYLAR